MKKAIIKINKIFRKKLVRPLPNEFIKNGKKTGSSWSLIGVMFTLWTMRSSSEVNHDI